MRVSHGLQHCAQDWVVPGHGRHIRQQLIVKHPVAVFTKVELQASESLNLPMIVKELTREHKHHLEPPFYGSIHALVTVANCGRLFDAEVVRQHLDIL